MTYLFTKEGCGKCDWVKTNVDLESMKDVTVMSLNREDPDPFDHDNEQEEEDKKLRGELQTELIPSAQFTGKKGDVDMAFGV